MRLLVSVRSAAEAAAALAGGADIVDAKEPAAGALGAVTADVLREIAAAVAGRRRVTAALGDARDEQAIADAAGRAAAAGAQLVKVGFAAIDSVNRASQLLAAAVDGASGAGTIAVAYADHAAIGSLPAEAVLDAAVRAGAVGLLIDTADKQGPALRTLVDPLRLQAWVAAAHDAGLLAAVAGQLGADDATWLADVEVDVVGVRGAACDGGRNGVVTATRVRLLAAVLGTLAPRRAPNGGRRQFSGRVLLPDRLA